MLQRHLLQQALSSEGHEVLLNADPAKLDQLALDEYEPDVWLVNLTASQAQTDELLDSLFALPAPVLIGEDRAPEQSSEEFAYWRRSLSEKLSRFGCRNAETPAPPAMAQPVVVAEATEPMQRLSLPEALESVSAQTGCAQPANEVWLLAGSLGGPVAVKEFLDVLPAGLPVGFLYAQHIDASFEQSLPRVVGRHSQWRVRNAENPDRILEGEVVVVPISQVLEFADTGTLHKVEQQWSGLYSPSIEQVMNSLAASHARRSGCIIFSGMGEDGSLACEFVSKQGVPIWTQSEETCACPSMPESVRKTGFSSYSSSPRGLAMALINHLLRAHKLKTAGSA